MNRLASILPAAHVLVNVDATSKKRAFEEAGLLFESQHGLSRAQGVGCRVRQAEIPCDLDPHHGRQLRGRQQAAVPAFDGLALGIQRGGIESLIQAAVLHGCAHLRARLQGMAPWAQ